METGSTIPLGSFKFSNRSLGVLPPAGTSSGFSPDSKYQPQIKINDYDSSGNIIEQQKVNDVEQSYIWDYNRTYPVAEVINSPVADIAYTSFEADGKGNWTYSGTPVADATAPTGKNAFTIVGSANNITKTGLGTTTTYVVSYWKKSGTVSVNGTTPITGKTINGWTYYEHKVINPSGGLVTVSGTNGIIDELRLYPSTAQMTTYTYEPLVGMTSRCDVNNRITYYEYDGFGRLFIVRDQDKNIIRKICYNCAGQEEDCFRIGNEPQSRYIRRNNCTSCQIGSYVTYTVAADTYFASSQAAANTLALNDINANAQTYANANGTCTAPPNVAVNVVNNTFEYVSIVFTNTCTSGGINYTVKPGESTSFGPFPEGIYDISLQAPEPYTFIVNGYSQSGISTAYFYNIPISIGNASITINY